ncbi:MAG: CBS domain-containing protein [Candidatus Bathyarchaeota archaeon]|nr:MAG: CBS domain-containing protein [Candidatus Bathyarchaeota archaeon]
MSLAVQDIMVDRVITIGTDVTVKKAAKLMNEHEIGCLVVVEKGKPVGIVTERDLLKRVLAKSGKDKQRKVSQIMTKPLLSVSPSMEIEEAAKFMFDRKIKKLPIIKEGKLLGLLTLTDILRIQPQLIRMYKIFTSDLAPRRMKKVFDYYLLLHTEFDTFAQNPHRVLRNLNK